MKNLIEQWRRKRQNISDRDSGVILVLEYIIRLGLYPESELVETWKEDIYYCLNHFRTVFKKYPSIEFLTKYVESKFDSIDSNIQYIVAKYGKRHDSSYSNGWIHYVFKQYIEWLAQELSIFGCVHMGEVISAIEYITSTTVDFR